MSTVQLATPSPKLLELRLSTGTYRYTNAGELEQRCTRCHSYWPADSEFFYPMAAKPGGLRGHCRACEQEWQAAKRGRAQQ